MPDWTDLQTITYVLAFLTSTLMVYGLIHLLMSLRRQDHGRIQRRLDHDWGRSAGKDKGNDKLVKDPTEDQKWAMARWLAASKRGISFRKICVQAAVPWPAHHVLAAIGLTLIVVMLLGILLNYNPFTLLTIVIVIVFGPVIAIVFKRNRRLRRFTEQMPEAFELLSQSLRAGHSLPTGILLVAEQIPDPLGTEFSRVHSEQDLGIPMDEALNHLADRIDLLDLRMFVTAVQIQRQTGGDLTEILDRISAVIRDRIKILGQVRALTAEGRLSGWVLTSLPLAVFLLLFQVNPEHPRKLLENPLGHLMVGSALFLQVTGMLIIRKIVNIKV